MSTSNFAFQFTPPLFLSRPHSGPEPGLQCRTATMQNGKVGVMFDCTHTSVIQQASPIHPGIDSPFNMLYS